MTYDEYVEIAEKLGLKLTSEIQQVLLEVYYAGYATGQKTLNQMWMRAIDNAAGGNHDAA